MQEKLTIIPPEMNSKASFGCLAPVGITRMSVSTMDGGGTRSGSTEGNGATPHSKSGGA